MKLTFKSKFTEAGNAVSFIFKPEQEIIWKAGQYIRFELLIDGRKDEHWFTIASAPHEKDIQITTRVSDSAFKQALKKLEPGDTIVADGLKGDFVWDEETDKPKVLIATGIGITSFHSMLKERAKFGFPLTAVLLYANRDNDIPFQAELDRWTAEHPELNVVYIIGEPLTAKLIAQHIPNLHDSLVYVSGPEPLVEKLCSELTKEAGLTKDQLKQDWYQGYAATEY